MTHLYTILDTVYMCTKIDTPIAEVYAPNTTTLCNATQICEYVLPSIRRNSSTLI